MSANNYLKIDRKSFTVSYCDIESDRGLLVGKGKTIDEAIDIAQRYREEEIVEYGIFFTEKTPNKCTKQEVKQPIKGQLLS